MWWPLLNTVKISTYHSIYTLEPATLRHLSSSEDDSMEVEQVVIVHGKGDTDHEYYKGDTNHDSVQSEEKEEKEEEEDNNNHEDHSGEDMEIDSGPIHAMAPTRMDSQSEYASTVQMLTVAIPSNMASHHLASSSTSSFGLRHLWSLTPDCMTSGTSSRVCSVPPHDAWCPMVLSEERTFTIVYVPDPSRSMERKHTVDNIGWVTQFITPAQYDSISHLTGLQAR